MMPPYYPLLWSTLAIYGFVALATWNKLVGVLCFFFLLPAVLVCQALVRFICNICNLSISRRRLLMGAPAMALALVLLFYTNIFTTRSRVVTLTLAGQKPSGIRDLHILEDAWTDYTAWVYFRSNPQSLKHILEHPPFVRDEHGAEYFAFSSARFSAITNFQNSAHFIKFSRTDLAKAKGHCEIMTDSEFSFACILYSVD